MGNYDFLTSIEEIKLGEEVTKSQMVAFWNILIVHYELNYPKFTYENMEQLIDINPQSMAGNLNIVLRYIGLSRMNYLAAQQFKELPEKIADAEQFKLVSNNEIWKITYDEFNLPKQEYEQAINIVETLKQRELPKKNVQEIFEKVLMMNARK